MPKQTDEKSHDAAIAPGGGPLTRRGMLAGAAALAAGGTIGGAWAATEAPDPFHDPTYSVLPPRAALVGRLKPVARLAQERPRWINGIRVTGLPESVPELDERIAAIMVGTGIPGVSLAIARNNELVVARGYGRASLVGSVAVEPTMPATIMSVNKTVTTMAAMTLVRDGKLRLDQRAFELLRDGPLPGAAQPVDPRQFRIEVRHLMSHTSGLFNAVESLNDPPRFQALARAGTIRLIHGRIGQNDLVRSGMSKPLLFNPGEKMAYSGQGMQVLARIVEKISGMRLDRYIQRAMFDPLGIRSHYIGSYLGDEQYAALMLPNRETLYAMAPTVFDKAHNTHRPRPVDREYLSWGGADACGWGALNSLDLLRYVSAVPSLFGPQLWQQITERPPITKDDGQPGRSPFGLGWAVVERGGRKGINHGGGWLGERSFASLRPDGGSFAYLVNSDDDASIDRINAAAGQFLDRFDTLRLEPPSWQDYGFA